MRKSAMILSLGVLGLLAWAFGGSTTSSPPRGSAASSPPSGSAPAQNTAPGNPGDWPQWGRDDARNMATPEIGPETPPEVRRLWGPLPDSFNPGRVTRMTPATDPAHEPTGAEHPVLVDSASARNVKWMAQLGSQSFSNPVVAGGRVFVGTNNFHARDPAEHGPRGILMCLDERTGAFLWQFVVPKYTAMKMFDTLDLGICSSPTVDGDRVYLVTNRAEVVCLDARTLGQPAAVEPHGGELAVEPLWRFDMIAELNVRPHDTSNCSVLVHGDYVYVCISNGVDDSHHGPEHPDAPSLIVLDKRTGKLVAVDDADIGKSILHGQWSSPSLGTVNGRELVFFGAGDGFCYAFDAQPQPGPSGRPGVPKKVWWFDCNGPARRMKDGKPIKYPSREGPSEIIATPVFHDGRVYVAIGQDPMHGDGPGALCCIDAAGTGDISESGKVWVNTDLHRSLSNVSISGGLLFVADLSGAVRCIDPADGSQLWVHQMKGHVWGSTLVADGKVYVGDESGEFVALAVAREEKVLGRSNVGSSIYSTPIVANGVLYVASQTHLYAIAGQP